MEEEKPGLFVAELIKETRSPGSTVEDVFKRTRMDVLRGSHGKQAPWYSSTLEEEFIFSAPVDRPPVAQARTDPAPPAAKPQVSPPPAPAKPESMPDDKIATPAPPATGHAGQPPTPRGTNRSGSWMPEFAPIRTMSRPFTRADRSMRRTGTFPAPSKTSMRCPARPEGCRGAQQSLLGARHHQRSFRRTEGLQRGAAASTPLRRCLRQARPGTPEKGIVR